MPIRLSEKHGSSLSAVSNDLASELENAVRAVLNAWFQ
jgi:hypothetical protein